MELIIKMLVFALPVVILPFGTSYFEIPKVIVAELLIQTLLAIFLWKNSLHTLFRNYWPFVLVFLLSLFDILIMPSSTNFFGNIFRLQGTFLLWNLLVFSIVVNKIDHKPVHYVYPLFTLICLVCSLFIFGQNNATRSIGLLGEPNAFAALSIFCFPFVYQELWKKNKIFYQTVVIICILIILFSTRSRSGFIGFFLELFILWGHSYLKVSLKKLIQLSVLAGALTLFFPFFDKNYLFENRIQIWKTALYGGLQHPVTGWGFGNTEIALKWAATSLANNIRYVYVDSAHNIFLDWLLQLGIIGVFILTYLIFRSISVYIHKKNIAELSSFIGITAALCFNPTSVTVLIAFWWLIGKNYTNK